MRNWALPQADTYFATRLSADGFEIDHLIPALKYVKHWRVAVDGGAHIGTWSVELARHFERVISFEPARDTFTCLQENTRGLLNIFTMRAALGAVHAYGVVVDDPKRPGNTGARFLRANGAGDVVVRPLDELGLEHLDLLKLDVEGHEYEALIGGAETIRRCRPVIIAEFKRFEGERGGRDPELVAELLAKSIGGYREVERTRNDRIFVADAG